MELEPSSFHWANDAYVALNHVNNPPAEKWPAYSNAAQSFPPSAFTLPSSLINHTSIERYGQVTPPDELSPAGPNENSQCSREGSIPVEQLQNELPWPVEQQIRGLANYNQTSQQQQHPQPTSQKEESPGRASKRRRTSKQNSANQSAADPAPQQQPDPANPQPPKRKRGRPKSQPQLVEAYTADGFPFQVSSARQSHLEKNRVAAHKCRQRKKEYINGLEDRAREYSSKNKALKENVAMLREEVLELKNEVLRHAGCGFWAVDEYLARCAGDLLGIENPNLLPGSRKKSQTTSPTLATLAQQKVDREMSIGSTISQMSTDSPDQDANLYGGLDLINELDEEMDGPDD